LTRFVTLEELSRFVDRDVEFSLNAELMLESACQAVRDFCDQELDYTEDDAITIYVGHNVEILRLPELPIVEVSEVFVNDEDPMDPDDYEVRTGGIARVSGLLWAQGSRVHVTYSHGYALTLEDVDTDAGIYRIPSPLRVKALELAASGLTWQTTQGGNLTSETIGSYSYTVSEGSTDAALVITDADGTSIAKYRRVSVR
jgi:hypothetical protein